MEQFQNLITDTVNEALKKNSKQFGQRPSKGFVTRREACHKLNIHETTLSRWTREGRINSKGIGGRVYYLISDIQSALQTLNS